MNKNELDFEKARIGAGKFQQILGLIGLAMWLGTGLLAIYLILQGLEPIIRGNSPEAIGALTKLVEALKLGSVLGYVWGGLATGAWLWERKGKHRAIGKKSEYQKAAESGEPNQTGSGLDKIGGTPRGEVKK